MELYSNIVVDHNPIVVNQPFTATTNILNNSSSTFTGDLSLDLHSSDGTWIQTIQEYTNQTLQPGYYFPNITFSSTGLVGVPPGDYFLAAWDKPAGAVDWVIVSASTFSNPINVVISGQPLSADSYEPDNTEATAHQLPVSFSGNSANCSTTGSNIHSSVDVDFYKISLPVGYSYTINARVHDSGNDSTVYTADVMFNFKSGTKWSDAYDNEMPAPFIMNGGDLIFDVFPFFPGEIGTYLLDINISRNPVGIENAKENSNIRVFPNPAQDFVSFQFDLQRSEIVSGTLTNVYGQKVMEIAKGKYAAGKNNIKIDVSSIAPGCYFYELESQTEKSTGKLVITK